MLLPKLLEMFDTSWLKVFTFLGVWAVIWLPIAYVLSKIIGWQPGETLIPKQKLILLTSLYLFSPIILGWKLKIEDISLIDLGLSFHSNILFSIVLGLIVGLASLLIIFTLESICNLVTWHWKNSSELLTSLLPILLLSLLISVIEESVFRGYIFITLIDDYSLWWGAAISSLIFALLHLIWERKETLPQIPGLWLMGMVLILARIIDSNSLGLAIGLHAAWIWGLTCIDSAELITYSKKDSWLTGFNQQPLAGIAGILCLVITSFILWYISQNNLLAQLG